ncbi:hypothetical protein TNCV_5082551 [Trichonephila clavipes]|nr:hypothetical protein TNCV_5082551 [Trichonephila clavipes]
MFKMTPQVDNPDFICVLRAELATMCFVSYNVANTVAIVYYRTLCQKKVSQQFPGLEYWREKKSAVFYEGLLSINITEYSTFQEDVRAAVYQN